MFDKQPYIKIWSQHGFVLVDEQVFQDLLARGLEVRLLEPDGYPQVFGDDKPVDLLHRWVDRYYQSIGWLPPLPAGWEIHHANRKNKRDNRIRHLLRLSPQVHGRVTWRERRRYGREKQVDVNGLYRPHAPGRVVRRPDMVGKVRAIVEAGADPRLRLSAEEQEVEVHLWRQLDQLRCRARLEKPERKSSIPREAEKKEWNAYETRVLAAVVQARSSSAPAGRRSPLKQMRRGCTPGEAALVLALIVSGFDRGAATQLLDVPALVMARIVKREPVRIAIARWQTHGRYPKPCPKSLKRLVGADRLRLMRSDAHQRCTDQ